MLLVLARVCLYGSRAENGKEPRHVTYAHTVWEPDFASTYVYGYIDHMVPRLWVGPVAFGLEHRLFQCKCRREGHLTSP